MAGTSAIRPQVSGGESAEANLLRDAFRRRASHAIEHVARSASVEALAGALSAPTDFGAVARALGDAAVLGAALDLDPLADAFARGVSEREELVVKAGGLLSAAEIGRALGGISRQAIDKRRRANQLLAVRVAGDWRYPAAQIGADGQVPPGLAAVLARTAKMGAWATLDFLLAEDDALNGLSPLEALRRGGAQAAQLDRVLDAMNIDAFG